MGSAREAFDFLVESFQVTEEQAASSVGIPLEEILGWEERGGPDACRARSIFQFHSVVSSLVQELGDGWEDWVRSGDPSPLKMFTDGNIEGFSATAYPIIFRRGQNKVVDGTEDPFEGDEIKFTVSDRGFRSYEEIETNYGHRVQIRESSSAEEPKVWMEIDGKENVCGDETISLSAHLTFAQVDQIIRTLEVCRDNHYQNRG